MNLFEETLRYLGWRGQALDDRTKTQVEEAVFACEQIARPLHAFRFFGLDHTPEGILLGGTPVLLTGQGILRHFQEAEGAELMAATLGAPMDRELTRLSHSDPSRAVVMDAAATALIEAYCDDVEDQLRRKHRGEGKSALPRFSPGYGDLPLELQPSLLALLDTGRRIGLSCTAANLLIPRKSVTAFIGVCPGTKARAVSRGCASCDLRGSCDFSRCRRNHPQKEN